MIKVKVVEVIKEGQDGASELRSTMVGETYNLYGECIILGARLVLTVENPKPRERGAVISTSSICKVKVVHDKKIEVSTKSGTTYILRPVGCKVTQINKDHIFGDKDQRKWSLGEEESDEKL